MWAFWGREREEKVRPRVIGAEVCKGVEGGNNESEREEKGGGGKEDCESG